MKSSRTKTPPKTPPRAADPAAGAPAQSAAPSEEFVALARILRPQGRRGEVIAEVLTDFPELFAERSRLFLAIPSGARRELTLESHWAHKGRIVLKFAAVDSITDAEALSGATVEIPLSERSPAPEGAYFIRDLVGCRVFDGDRELGTIMDVEFGAGSAPLLKVRAGAKEWEIPFAEAYLKYLDLEHKQIRMDLPEGLLDIQAPLTVEERKRQQQGEG